MTHRSCAPRPRARLARGLLLPAVVWAIVVLGGVIATLASLMVRNNAALAQEVMGARALAAARAGTDWGAWLVRDPQGTLAPGAAVLPDCFAPQTALGLPTPLDGFNVQVTCTRYPATGTLDEGGLLLAVYQVVATASQGAANDAARVERRVQLRIETCKNPAGEAPTYSC
jgi:MSHA biogenesis protein MshP